jgi:peptidyl-prolyl cis-trans isomerase A (cyclophilin A)
LAMANSGPNTNGSQFFIMHVDYPLPYQYTIFGKVTDGLDVIDSIASVKTVEGDKPVEDVTIISITVSSS